jgi:hypothetical protein
VQTTIVNTVKERLESLLTLTRRDLARNLFNLYLPRLFFLLHPTLHRDSDIIFTLSDFCRFILMIFKR